MDGELLTKASEPPARTREVVLFFLFLIFSRGNSAVENSSVASEKGEVEKHPAAEKETKKSGGFCHKGDER